MDKLFIKRVFLPYAVGFAALTLMPQSKFESLALRLYYLQSCYMQGVPLRLP